MGQPGRREKQGFLGGCASCRRAGSAILRRWGWGGWGGGGGGVIACGSAESYGIYSVFYTCGCSCVLAVRADRSWNVSIYVGFACQQANHTVFTVFLLVFSRPFFSTRSDPMVFTVFCTPLHCLCALCLLMFLRVQPRKHSLALQ